VNDWSNEETDNPLLADDRNYYKVEKWTKDTKIKRMLYAGNDLEQHGRQPRSANEKSMFRRKNWPCGTLHGVSSQRRVTE
jgi:hypothetical protein